MNEHCHGQFAEHAEAFRAALSLEQKGHDYYVETALRAGNPLTKRVFESLAEQEVLHMNRIREVCEGVGSGETFAIPEGSLESAVNELFARFSSDQRNAWELDDAGAYEHAMELERQSYAMYDVLAVKAPSPAEAEFFRKLRDEENEHLVAIENVYNYLQRTGDWFAADESRVWNWMNM